MSKTYYLYYHFTGERMHLRVTLSNQSPAGWIPMGVWHGKSSATALWTFCQHLGMVLRDVNRVADRPDI